MEFQKYFNSFNTVLKKCLNNPHLKKDLAVATRIIKQTKKTKKKIILIGNGGSAAIAEHMAIDFTRNAGLRAMAISSSPMLTTFSNDYGYE